MTFQGFDEQSARSFPVGGRTVEIDGVCTVQLRDGRICSNQEFFDRADLLRALAGDETRVSRP